MVLHNCRNVLYTLYQTANEHSERSFTKVATEFQNFLLFVVGHV